MTMTEPEPGTPERVRVLLGTTNPAKADRIRRCLEGWPIETTGVDSQDIKDSTPPEESGATHLDVAREKAVAWARRSGGLAIASDGGVVIPSLGPQWDSLLTRRAAGADATDESRLVHLLELMAPFDSPADRRASWHEAVALADPSGVIQVWEVEGPTGAICHEPSPARIEGFWLACVWFFETHGKTYTELTTGELAQIGDPWMRLTEQIQRWLAGGGWRRLSEALGRQSANTP